VWNPESYRSKKAAQQPEYADAGKLEEVLSELATVPPLVTPGEVERLKTGIAEAGRGNQFILQGGDCVERFEDCTEDRITNKIKILLQMSVILTYAARKPVLKIGRIAGQYFKPRSSPFEAVDGVELPSYRGDGVNGNEYDAEIRAADPGRLRRSYFSATATLNFIRAMISGGFADLHNPYNWNLYPIEQNERWKEYRDIVEHIVDAVTFMESFGGINTESVGNVDFYTSHEGLHLGYEESMTRFDPASGKYYNTGAHMLWIGERTRAVDGAHAEYFRGVANPIGVKLGPDSANDDLPRLLDLLNPKNEPGKITLITRPGLNAVREGLPRIIREVKKSGAVVTWCADPMHGNTVATERGYKTRRFQDVLDELAASFEIHRGLDTSLSGVHFELTGDDVTECLGGGQNLGEKDLDARYESFCDPRLNYAQSMEMSFLISDYLKNEVN
jgi:3-deoxy-7-phosphoheptulonate synthase